MDFLDDIEVDRVPSTTYSFIPDTQVSEEEQTDHEGDHEQEQNSDDGPNMDILSKVRQRLFGQDTQLINTPAQDTQPINESFPFENSLLFSTQKINQPSEQINQPSESSQPSEQINQPNETQVINQLPQLPVDESEFRPKKLPQLSIGDAEINSSSKSSPVKPQPSKSQAVNLKLFVDLDDDEDPKYDRQAEIAKLAEIKRLKRLENEKSLENDLNHATLSDEEKELDDELYDKTIDSSTINHQPTRKELEEEDKFININKRKMEIRSNFKNKITFSKNQFLDDFDSDKEDQPDNLGLNNELKSSPVTSPIKKDVRRPDGEDDLLSINQSATPKQKQKPSTKNPIDLYAENLKRQLLSSPTKDGKFIDLDDSELDSDRQLSSIRNASSPIPYRSSLPLTSASNNNHQLDDLKEIPELSKESKLLLKKKFSTKKVQNSKNSKINSLPKNLRMNMIPNQNKIKHFDFLKNLHKSNINQLIELKKENPYLDIEEAVNEELEGDSLFNRELERSRNIRKKEKELEKAKLAKLAKLEDKDYNPVDEEIIDEVPDSDYDSNDVPDSEYDDEQDEIANEVDDENSDEADDEDEVSARRNRKLVVTDDEDDEHQPEINPKRRNDDSYMFGVASSSQINNEFEKEEDTVGISNSDIPIDISMVKPVIKGGLDSNPDKELFRNLKPRTDDGKDVSVAYDDGQEDSGPVELPSFQDISMSQQGTQTYQATQVDSATQADPTQIIESESTQKNSNSQGNHQDEADVDIKEALENGRQHIQQNRIEDIDHDKENDDETSEEIQQRIKMYQNKIRRQELKARKRRKDMEKKGLKNILEGEAEESEDEWKGIGGEDNDESDQANSEDERMIDNNFNIDLNDEEIRQKFMEDFKIKDQKQLEKLMDDVKNHRLTRRAGINSLDVDYEDEEDEIFRLFKRQVLQKQRQEFLKNKKLRKAAKNEKAKAFLDLVQDNSNNPIVIDDEIEDSDDGNHSDEGDSKAKSESPFNDSNNTTDKDDDGDDDNQELNASKKKRPTLKIKESFVRKTLSFLATDSNRDDDDYERQQKISRYQHGVNSSDDEVDDVKALKNKSLSNLQSNSVIDIDSSLLKTDKRSFADSQATDGDDFEIDDDDEGLMRMFKKPSIIKSFKSGSDLNSSANSFSGVTVSKQYKVASGSKASITYMSKNLKQNNKIKSLRAQRIEQGVKEVKNNSSVKGIFKNHGFD